MVRSRGTSALVVLLLALVLVVVPDGTGLTPSGPRAGAEAVVPMQVPAVVGGDGRSFDRRFSRGFAALRPGIGRCIGVRVTGRVRARRTYAGRGDPQVWWHDPRIVHPKVKVTTRKYLSHPTGGTCGDTARVSKFRLRQVWQAGACKPRIDSVSVGIWSIGVGFSCDQDDAAARRSTSYGRGRVAVQKNSSTTIRYKTVFFLPKKDFVAKARVTAVVTRRMNGRSVSDEASQVITVRLPD